MRVHCRNAEGRILVMSVQDPHVMSLATSTTLSRYYVPQAITPLEVIRVLNGAHISFVLVGAHGLGGWMHEPRATEDVDVVVAARHQKKAVRALLEKFEHLVADEREVVIRLRDRGTKQVVIDIMKPNQTLYRETFKHTHPVSSGGQTYRIPSLEMALTMKFAPMISLYRNDEDKHQDAHDFIRMAKTNPDIDFEELARLGELVYVGGGKEIVEKVRQVRAGEKLIL